MDYKVPLRDMNFVIGELLGSVDCIKAMKIYEGVDEELIEQILEQAAQFAQNEIAPINYSGDQEGCEHDALSKSVKTPKGFKEAYDIFVKTGWPALSCDREDGGQQMPYFVNSLVYEMLNSSNQAWTMYPGLSHGAYNCIKQSANDELKKIYLPKLASGEWTGTMCLTEACCGTDLGLLRTKAVKREDGSYELSGAKIFISAGEHDLASNIAHLVLARCVGASSGSSGLSLFVVPKFLPGLDGALNERNKIYCERLEKKMGIHGNATCELVMDGAVGWLVGEESKGLASMFVMMNAARLGVAVQSLGLTEASYQLAKAYASERRQSKSLGVDDGSRADQAADLIIEHADVRRMLLTAKAWSQGAGAFAIWLAQNIDIEKNHEDETARKDAGDLVALLTPVAKSFMSENASAAANEALQVFGGHGYISESKIEQYVRDARICSIYEGANGVQALDLLGRKVLLDNGAKLRKLGSLISAFIKGCEEVEGMREFTDPLSVLGGQVTQLTMEIGMKALGSKNEVAGGATPYLRVIGHLVYAWLFARMALISINKKADGGDEFYDKKLVLARFYYERLMPETSWLIKAARSGVGNLGSSKDI